MSCTTDFKSRCDPIITDLDPDGIIMANVLVSLAIKSNMKYPLLFLPDFVEDLVNGMYSRKMMNKYHIHTYNDFSTLTSTIKLGKRRTKRHSEDCKEENLLIRDWSHQYNILTSQFGLFRPQLINMLNCSVLRTLVAHAILRLQYISYNNIERSVLESYDALKASLHMPQDAAFEDYIGNGLARKIDLVIARMAQESFLTSIDGDISLPAKYEHMKIRMLDIIKARNGSMQYQSLVTKTLGEFPLFRMLLGRDKIDDILDTLERDGSIICKRAFWKFAPYTNQFFSSDAYTAHVEEMKAQAVSLGRIKFFGRRITPDQFITELRTLELGDLDDQDDQVTRIAGLMLSDAMQLRSPAEHVPGFDFVMDFTNCNFRPEQEDMMRRLDLEVRSNTFHCKVMINDEIPARVIDELCRAIPNGEQGVVFTCSPVSSDIRRQIRNDRTVQIIDEDGIRAWCSIVPTIPCRLNSIAQVMYGDHRGKAVAVRSVNYESGMATMEAAPERNEMMLPIGCLEEIGPDTDVRMYTDVGNLTYKQSNVWNEDDYSASISEEYFGFLCDLASLAPDTFGNRLGLNVRSIHWTRLDLMKNIRPELFGGTHPDVHILNGSRYDRYVEFENGIYSTVNIQSAERDNSFMCECGHKLNETYRFTLCGHLVVAIMRLVQEKFGDWESTKRQICTFRKKLRAFRMTNVLKMVLALRDVIGDDSKQVLNEYVWSYMPSDDNDHEGRDILNDAGLSDAKKNIRNLLENDPEMLGLLEMLERDMVRLDAISLRRVTNTLSS